MRIGRALECGVAREGEIDGKKKGCNSKRVIMTRELWATTTTVRDFRQQENRTMGKELMVAINLKEPWKSPGCSK